MARARRLALSLLAAAALAACAPAQRAAAPAAPRPVPQAPAEARVNLMAPAPVALLLPMSAGGAVAAEAQGIANAARMAIEELGPDAVTLSIIDTGTGERSGGMSGDRTGASGAAAATRRALDGGAALILGPLFAADAAQAGRIAAQRGVNVISFSTSADVAGGNVWLAGQLPSDEARRIIGFARDRGFARIGLFRPDTPYGLAALDAVRGAAGGALVAQGVYNRSFEGIQAAAKPYADQHLAAGADAVVLPEEGQGLRTVAAFLDFEGVSPREGKYLGLGIWAKDPDVRKEGSLQGGWFAAADPFRLDAFARRYAARFGEAPQWLTPLGYDVAAAAVAMMRAGREQRLETPFDAAAITDPAGFAGATGRVRFTRDGLNTRALAVLEVTGDGFLVVDPAPRAPGEAAGF